MKSFELWKRRSWPTCRPRVRRSSWGSWCRGATTSCTPARSVGQRCWGSRSFSWNFHWFWRSQSLVPPVAGEYGGALLHQLLPHCLGVRLRQLRHILKSSRWVLDSSGLIKSTCFARKLTTVSKSQLRYSSPMLSHTEDVQMWEPRDIEPAELHISRKRRKIFTVQWHVAYS